MKTRFYAVSLNPSEYNVCEIRQMSLDEARTFFDNDDVMCKSVVEGNIEEVDKLMPEGNASDLDTLLVWFY